MSPVTAAREPTSDMPSSSSSSASPSSSDDNDDDPDYRVDASDDDDLGYRAATPDDGNDATAVVLPMHVDAEGVVSSLCTQDDVDALCRKYGVPKGQYTARPAGDLRASSSPPPGAVCVYAHALEPGMRVPLHPFFRDALAHFGMAPTQLTPNGWRIMAGFAVLCHSVGVPLSLAVFRHFFALFPLPPVKNKHKCWYFFRSRETSGLCLAGLPHQNKDWKHGFFFLLSPEPWTCPVECGEPPPLEEPALNGEEVEIAEKLVKAHDAAPVDLRTYLCDINLEAAMISPASPVPAALPSCDRTSAGAKVMDPSVYDMMKTVLAKKAAAVQTSARKVKTEPGSSPSCGKKRSLDEANREDGPTSSVLRNNPPAAHGYSVPTGAFSPPTGFPRTPQHFASRLDDDSADWEAARDLLRGAVSPAKERAFAASRPSDVLASCYVTVHKAANYASFSFDYALELEKKLAARDAEVAALRGQLEKAKAKLAAVNSRRRT